MNDFTRISALGVNRLISVVFTTALTVGTINFVPTIAVANPLTQVSTNNSPFSTMPQFLPCPNNDNSSLTPAIWVGINSANDRAPL